MTQNGDPHTKQIKPKTNQVCFRSNLRNINKLLKCTPYPMPKINEILFKLEGFQFTLSLDLNMGYYNIQLSKNASNLFTIIIPWVNIVTNVYQW